MKRLTILIGAAIFIVSAPIFAADDSKPLNVVVGLDLSDRIGPKHPEQASADIEIITGLVKSFETRMRDEHLFLMATDRLTVAVIPQLGISYMKELAQMQPHLTIDMATVLGAPAFKNKRDKLLTSVNRLYGLAAQETDYTGADLWSWIKDLDLYLDGNMTNIVVVISDGYLLQNRSIAQLQCGNRFSSMRLSPYRIPDGLERLKREDGGLISFPLKHAAQTTMVMVEIDFQDKRDRNLVSYILTKWFDEIGFEDYQLVTKTTPQQTTLSLNNWFSD